MIICNNSMCYKLLPPFYYTSIFNFLRNPMHYIDYLYIERCKSKNIKKLYYKSMRLDKSNKISLEYIFSYTLVTIYKISLNDK